MRGRLFLAAVLAVTLAAVLPTRTATAWPRYFGGYGYGYGYGYVNPALARAYAVQAYYQNARLAAAYQGAARAATGQSLYGGTPVQKLQRAAAARLAVQQQARALYAARVNALRGGRIRGGGGTVTGGGGGGDDSSDSGPAPSSDSSAPASSGC
jgi:hypothetical protein